jgi:hypothetical protein
MQVPAFLIVLAMSVPVAAASPVTAPASKADPLSAKCPRTTSYLAGKSSAWRGEPMGPRKLTELPDATAFMAVYRHVGGCEAPLTMVDYRSSRRR